MLQADKLRNAHQLNLDSVDEKIKYMEKCEKDYKEVIATLEKLSSEHRLEIMAPLTKKAFMPGELVHTGEVMVYLGDNWFANRTVAQGIEIAKRRCGKIASELTDYRKCLDNIQNKIDMSSELDDGGIIEALTEEDIARSENRHKAREPKPDVPRPRAAFTSEELAALIRSDSEVTSEEESDNEETFPSAIRQHESSSQDEADDDNTILFSHSENPPLHKDDTLHPGNLYTLLRTVEEKAVIEKVHKKRRSKFDINSCVIEERIAPASALPSKQTPAAVPPAKQRPVSKFKMNRTT